MDVTRYDNAIVICPTTRNPEVDIVDWERSIDWAIEESIPLVVFDCSYLDLLTSMGLVFFLATHTRASERGISFRVCNLRGMVARAVEAAKLHRLLDIRDTVEDAIAQPA